jgi:hypothetical protein
MLQRVSGSGQTFSEVIHRKIRGQGAQEFFDVRTLTPDELDAIVRSETATQWP